MKIALIGAGSQTFGPSTVRDILLSDVLSEIGVEIALVDVAPEPLAVVEAYTRHLIETLGRRARVSATTELRAALADARFVVTAIEVDRWLHWSQDFHVPWKYGCGQVFAENGGPAGLFHALRNMTPMMSIANAIEETAPDALLINFTNPEHKLCEAISRLTTVQVVGLCHGVFSGISQISRLLEMHPNDLDVAACGMNHFSWFQRIRDAHTGEDLYPRLRAAEQQAEWVYDWHEIGLSRILLRRFGLWPSPGANHIGEYLRWAEEFVATELQYFHDPWDGEPWKQGVVRRGDIAEVPLGDAASQPGKAIEFFYYIDRADVTRPPHYEPPMPAPLEASPLEASGELTVPIIEALAGGVTRELPAINVPNHGAIPGLPDEMVVEIPAIANLSGLQPTQMEPLPEPIAALIRLQGSIHKLLVEAFAERSKEKLLQAILLDPTVDSYRRAVAMMNEMLDLQRDLLPVLS